MIMLRKPFDGNFKTSQLFGEWPDHYKSYGYAGHFGVDYLTPYGTQIKAVDNGTVSRCGSTAGNGNYIELKHIWGTSIYLHFSKLSNFAIGATVKKGDLLGLAGNTGDVSPKPTPANPLGGTHLHFSMKINCMKNPAYKDYIDPLPFLENVLQFS